MTPTPATPDEGLFTPFHGMIAAHAASQPGGTAFLEGDRALDWKTLHLRVGQVARALVAGGVAPGDHVAILGFPSLPYAECLFGAVAARACVVPLVVSASAETLAVMLADCDAKMVFLDPAADASLVRVVDDFSASRAVPVVRFGDAGTDGDEYPAWRARGAADGVAASLPQSEPGDAFNIIYSSGTTGVPKGIVHLHGMRQQQARRNGFGFTPHSRTLLSTPMYSNTTLTPMLGTVANGGTCVLMRKFDAGHYLALAASRRATHTMLVPVQYKRILAHADFVRSDLSAFELSQCTGAPLELAVKRDILARWPGRFLEGYGLTEGGVTCFLDARQDPGKLATVGRPAPGTEVFLIDEAGHRLPPDPTGTSVGEVVGRSPFMMAGYHRRPDATAEIRWHDTQGRMYHRTGDIGRFDADGFLTLLDRSKDVVISGGHNIYPADLEAVLARHADVLESAVIGVPSAEWGETPLALVVAKPGMAVDATALRDWVNTQVGRLQRLSAVELRDELPRSHLGKLSKRELRAPYWSRAGAAPAAP
ncbi:MAG: AMP-binding protein [Pseudomonadota bacterium]